MRIEFAMYVLAAVAMCQLAATQGGGQGGGQGGQGGQGGGQGGQGGGQGGQGGGQGGQGGQGGGQVGHGGQNPDPQQGGHNQGHGHHRHHHHRHRCDPQKCHSHHHHPCRYFQCPYPPQPLPSCEEILGCSKTLVHGCSAQYDYAIFYGEAETTKAMAREKCVCIGGALADIDSANILCVSSSLTPSSTPAYINSWNTDTYLDARIALYPNAAIAVPGGDDRQSFICQIPKLLLQNDDVDTDNDDNHHHQNWDDDYQKMISKGMLGFSEGFDHSCCHFHSAKLSASNMKRLSSLKKSRQAALNLNEQQSSSLEKQEFYAAA